MKQYRVRNNADVWSRPVGGNHAGQLRTGDIVSIGWFWPGGRGKIEQGNHLGKYVNQVDLVEYAPEPPPVEPPTTPAERIEQYDEEGNLVQIWVPQD